MTIWPIKKENKAKARYAFAQTRRWEGRVVIGYDEKGLPKTKSVFAHTKDACLEKLSTLKEQYGRISERLKPDMLLGDWIDFWYQYFSKPKLRVTTYSTYENRIYVHIIPGIGQIPLNKLSQNDLQQFYAKLKRTGRKRTWKTKAHSCLTEWYAPVMPSAGRLLKRRSTKACLPKIPPSAVNSRLRKTQR
ncbi:MAG: N-terminal phage integrase SAM-like domain-containing protein [Christensenellaceae bacterium]